MHVVAVSRRGELSSSTLDAARLARLQAAWRESPWYRDRWTHMIFRAAAIETLRGEPDAGLVLIHSALKLTPPPAFDEMFEPIPLDGSTGDDAPQMLAITGVNRTREERMQRVGLVLIGVLLLCALVPLLTFAIVGRATRPLLVFFGLLAGIAGLVFCVKFVQGLGRRWYVVPGGTAIVSRGVRDAERVEIRTRSDTVATLRLVSNGKATFRVLELFTADGRRLRQVISERESIAFLAGWASRQTPPSAEMLAEVVAPEG
jgi:hypothetical protein